MGNFASKMGWKSKSHSQSSLSQAVFQAFRNSQMNPPHPITRKPTLLQRPRWSQWFGKQAEEDVRSSSFKSSFTARASASMQVEISVLSLDFYAPNLNNTPPGTAALL
ncbi:hypothetical protein VP01_246g4 [Puccinia sorghi]|uniref:Uncharacterized protein n=1 Tax=Puccinia sorghi TaxID=27349 RepID=A0A0L6V619_9BASI|nr:hypothetical protein VP01_246g4 [Puccinia sorghi]